jgi:hypothetical protein
MAAAVRCNDREAQWSALTLELLMEAFGIAPIPA